MPAHPATLYVNANGNNPNPPYSDWSIAATNIQDAIDAASDGDMVLVTNGIYASGGRVMAGDLTNRVALNKAITVQSVNGPFVTIIQGAGATNGTSAVRCAWLTNGASLIGFTLQGGATRVSGSSTVRTAGGVWCASYTNVLVANCVIRSNTATALVAGAYQGNLRNCFITQNAGSAAIVGGAGYGILNNCTVVSNSFYGSDSYCTNCIVYFNAQNSAGGSFTFCDTIPPQAGTGNITNNPQFFVDGIHLGMSSPCLGTGTNIATGTDLFGQAWLNPPSMGCAEIPSSPLVAAPSYRFTDSPAGFSIGAQAIGQGTLAFSWLKDGVALQDDGHYTWSQTTNLVAIGVKPYDDGLYQLVVSNSFGCVTSAPVQVIIHFVDVGGTNPVSPFTNWNSAATTIQDAVDAAVPGEIVLVTNGIYSSGGRAVTGDVTNRVALDKPILLTSVNGWSSSIIEGALDTMTNGPLAMRGVRITTNAVLSGFTVRNGATLGGFTSYPTDLSDPRYGGGGVWCNASDGFVVNCVFTNNYSRYGAAAAHGSLLNCLITGNLSSCGYGAVAFSSITNCTVVNNNSTSQNGGIAGVFGNYGPGGVVTAGNSIVLYNRDTALMPSGLTNANYSISASFFMWSCSDPLPAGSGNIDADPQLLDRMHIASTSPCRGAGSAVYSSGLDIDGEPWAAPPSMGCDEVVDSNLIGPLSMTLQAGFTNSVLNRPVNFVSTVTGRASHLTWTFGDGSPVANAGYSVAHSWTNVGDYLVTATAYNNDNPSGVSASLPVHILPLIPPTLYSAFVTNDVLSYFRFQFYGQPNAVYFVLETSDLSVDPTNWIPVQVLFGNDAPLQASILLSPFYPVEFYRIQPW